MRIAGSVAVAGAIVFAVSHGDTEEPGRSPVARVASFSAARADTSLPDAAARQRFVRAFSHRSFSLGSVDDFSVVAAPAAKGRICYLDSVGGDGCIDAFRGGAGMSEGYRRVNGGNLSTTARHNVFEFVVPQGAVISTYTLTREDGSTRTERWPAVGSG